MIRTSDRTTFERLSYSINQLLDEIDETLETDVKKQMRVRRLLIRTLYWLDRYMSERYFENRNKEQKEEGKKIKKAKKKLR